MNTSKITSVYIVTVTVVVHTFDGGKLLVIYQRFSS